MDLLYRIMGKINSLLSKETLINQRTRKPLPKRVRSPEYTVDADGFIDQLSKRVPQDIALGEAVGINYISKKDKKALISRLEQVDEQDYFEGGIELTIQENGTKWTPVDISQFYAVEVDFPEDLVRANQEI